MFYILRDRVPVLVDVCEWAAWFETADRCVARTEVTRGITVSTVFVGMAMYEDGLFETQVFGGYLDGLQRRPPTWEAAARAYGSLTSRGSELAYGFCPLLLIIPPRLSPVGGALRSSEIASTVVAARSVCTGHTPMFEET